MHDSKRFLCPICPSDRVPQERNEVRRHLKVRHRWAQQQIDEAIPLERPHGSAERIGQKPWQRPIQSQPSRSSQHSQGSHQSQGSQYYQESHFPERRTVKEKPWQRFSQALQHSQASQQSEVQLSMEYVFEDSEVEEDDLDQYGDQTRDVDQNEDMDEDSEAVDEHQYVIRNGEDIEQFANVFEDVTDDDHIADEDEGEHIEGDSANEREDVDDDEIEYVNEGEDLHEGEEMDAYEDDTGYPDEVEDTNGHEDANAYDGEAGYVDEEERVHTDDEGTDASQTEDLDGGQYLPRDEVEGPPPMSFEKPFICLHTGAGYHHPATHASHIYLLKKATRAGMISLRHSKSSTTALTAAMQFLEDSPLTNAGYGSNLTLYGTVECDASMMSGDGSFGAIAAVSGIRNPIKGARAVMEADRDGEGVCGLVSPVVLCNEGATKWCSERGVELVADGHLVSEKSRKRWERHLQCLSEAARQTPKRAREHNVERNNDKRQRLSAPFPPLDTIGGICLSQSSEITSATSSGGTSLKPPGRIGSASTYGVAAWAETTPTTHIGISVTGTGEQLVKTLFASHCARLISTSRDVYYGLKKALEDFLNHPWLAKYEDKNVGVIVFRSAVIEADDDTVSDSDTLLNGARRRINRRQNRRCIREFWWAHTTETFCISWMSGDDTEPHTHVSCLSQTAGAKFCIEGRTV